MTSWARGSACINDMLSRNELQSVPADENLAWHLLQEAEKHLQSSKAIKELDTSGAYALLHDATRKAMDAMLQIQGLRSTKNGGHLATQTAVKAQFEASMGKLLRGVDRIRTTRHRAEYPDKANHISIDDVEDAAKKAFDMVEAAKKAIPHLGVYCN